MGTRRHNYFCFAAIAGLLALPAMAQSERAGNSLSEQNSVTQVSDVSAQLKVAGAAFDAGDTETALRIWRKLAAEGVYAARYNLGLAYSRGSGVPKDPSMALDWYKKAAAVAVFTEEAQANFEVGIHYFHGLGVAADKAEAFKWILSAAEEGHVEAQYNVGLLYADGIGVAQDIGQSIKWLRIAAYEGGHGEAKEAFKKVQEYVQRRKLEESSPSGRAKSILVSGRYYARVNRESDFVCFDVDKTSVSVLPIEISLRATERRSESVYFCFNGGIDPKKALAIPRRTGECGVEGKAVVEARNFDGFTNAELVAVKSKSPPTVIVCRED